MKSSLLRSFSLVILIIAVLFGVNPLVTAQSTDTPEYPTYIIQSGDTLATIAYQFGISLDELIAINNIENPNAISEGMEIILPTLPGINGTLTTINVALGDTIRSLSIQYAIPESTLIQLNKLSSYAEMYQGASLIVPMQEEEANSVPISELNSQTTMLELATANHLNSWQLSARNQKNNTWNYINAEALYGVKSDLSVSPFAAEVISLEINPSPLYQGNGAEIRLKTTQPLQLAGSLGGYALHFFEEEPNTYVAYQGIYAQVEPGLIDFNVSAVNNGEPVFSLEQMLPVNNSGYYAESLIVDPATIDPATMESEQELILGYTSNATPTKYWQGTFSCVVDQPICIRSWYGTARNYNDGIYYNFHSGLDYGVCATLNIYAAADGVVAYTGSLTVRGNTTYIDHGWGVYSGHFHQDQIFVKEGEFVEAGQLIGNIGATGRVTGAHLHYEILMNGVHIDPLLWLDASCQ